MKKIAILSLFLNALLFAILLLDRIPILVGSGQMEASGKDLSASAMSYSDKNPLHSNKIFYRFSVWGSTPDSKIRELANVDFRYPDTTDDQIMRSYPQVIKWNEAGNEVRFTTPEIEVTLKKLK